MTDDATQPTDPAGEKRATPDPNGYAIRYADEGGFEAVRLADEKVIGPYATRDEAIEAALADRDA